MQDVRAVWKWLGAIVASVAVASLVYVASTITTMSIQLAVMQVDIGHLRAEVAAGTADRYTGAQATAAERARDKQLAALEKRIDEIAARTEHGGTGAR